MTLTTRFLSVIICMCLSVLTLTAQGWKRTYSSISTTLGTYQTDDNGFIMCGVNSDNVLVVLKTDADGVVLRTKTYANISKISELHLAKTTDGGCVIAINDTSPSVRLVKLTPNGDSVWSKRIPFNVNIKVIRVLANNGIGILGANRNNAAVLAKCGATGDTLWTKLYPEPTDILNGFQEDTDGTIFWQINDKTTNRAILWILNKNGQLLNSINIATSITGLYRITRLKDGDLAACTSREVVKFKTDGREVWKATASFINEKDIVNITPTQDGGVAVLGYGGGQPLYETELLKINANGTFAWSKKTTEDIESNPTIDYVTYNLFNLQECSDNGFLLMGRVDNFTSGIVRKTGYLIKTNGTGLVYANRITGRIAGDLNNNCKIDGNDLPISGWVLKADGGVNKVFNAVSDANGRYTFQLDSGRYKISVFAPNNLWQPCFTDSLITVAGFDKTISFDMPLKPVLSCSGLRVDIGTPLLRRCFDNTYTVSYCNNGTLPVFNAYVEVTLDTNLIFQSASKPVVSRNNRTYRFNVGDVDVLHCGVFNIIVKASCATPSVLGRTACTEAHIYPDTVCPSWRGAKMEVRGRCDRDSIRFSLQNTGQQTTSNPIKHTIIEDHVVFLQGSRPFNAGESVNFAFKPNGKTFRLQAEQERGYPTNQSLVAITIEGCGTNTSGDISRGFVLQLPEADGDPFLDTDCQSIVGSAESNTKLASPVGYQTDHFIEQNTDLEYMIRFQNVGTDTAFNVIVRDTLSPFLEPTSIQVGASSHPYTYDILGNDVIKFTFSNIRLPDSTLNGAASQGFIKFRISQKPNIPTGTKILNKAALFFDYNTPIITSRTFHTVGKNFMVSAIVEKNNTNRLPIKVYPNPFTDKAFFEIENDDAVTPLSIPAVFNLYDATGRLIRTETFKGNRFEFEREALGQGFYLFTIERDGKKGVGKLIVQ
jgi:hypothetical protein